MGRFLIDLPGSPVPAKTIVGLRWTALVGASIGLAWAAFMAVIPHMGSSWEVWALASGIAAAAYTTVIYCARPRQRRSGGNIIVLVVTGITHLFWAVFGGMGVRELFRVGVDESTALLGVTGVGYALVLFAVTGTWSAGIAMLLGTVAAIVMDRNLTGGEGMFPGIAILHATIVASMTATTWMAIGRHKPAHLCPKCDYDLRGTNGLRCPECGITKLAQEKGEARS